jgi:hypothetical protein
MLDETETSAMNPEDLVLLAREIYISMVAANPNDWDRRKMAKQAMEAATQFKLTIQNEREGRLETIPQAAPGFQQQTQGPQPGNPAQPPQPAPPPTPGQPAPPPRPMPPPVTPRPAQQQQVK